MFRQIGPTALLRRMYSIYTPNVDVRIGRPGYFLSMLTGGEFPTSPLKFPTSPCPFPTSDFAVFRPNFCYYSLFIRPSDRQ
jgi:hypothetical protein